MGVLNDDLLRLQDFHLRVVIVVEFLRLEAAEAGILIEAVAWRMKASVTIDWALVVQIITDRRQSNFIFRGHPPIVSLEDI